MTSRRYAVVAGGGTGGHVLQALAVARALAVRGHGAGSIELAGSSRGQEERLLAGEGFPLTLLPGRGLVRRLTPEALLANLQALVGLLWATARMLADLLRRRPRAVVTVGGYAALPAGTAAALLRVPLVVLNVDAVPGLVNRLLGRLATACAVAFPGTPLPRARLTGAAVRLEIASVDRSPEAARAARRALGLPPGRQTVCVFGGSLGARRVNLATLELARSWRNRSELTIYHVAGRRDHEEMASMVSGPDRGAAPGRSAGPGDLEELCYRMVAFEDRMELLYQAADLVVCRSGAITVAELAVAGVPAVLVPLPGAPGDHQRANADALVAAGAAVRLEDGRCNGEELAQVVGRLLEDQDRRQAMSRAARAFGRPDAAERIADLVEEVAGVPG